MNRVGGGRGSGRPARSAANRVPGWAIPLDRSGPMWLASSLVNPDAEPAGIRARGPAQTTVSAQTKWAGTDGTVRVEHARFPAGWNYCVNRVKAFANPDGKGTVMCRNPPRGSRSTVRLLPQVQREVVLPAPDFKLPVATQTSRIPASALPSSYCAVSRQISDSTPYLA